MKDDITCTRIKQMLKDITYKSIRQVYKWKNSFDGISYGTHPKNNTLNSYMYMYSSFGDKEIKDLIKNFSEKTFLDKELLCK